MFLVLCERELSNFPGELIPRNGSYRVR